MLSTQQVTPRKIRVMLVDDSAILLREAIPFLGQHPNIELVGAVSLAAQAVTLVEILMPDVVLLDVTTRGLNGLPVIPQLHAVNPDLAIIVLDEVDIYSVKRAAFAHGAAAFITKQSAKTGLLPAILALTQPDDLNA